MCILGWVTKANINDLEGSFLGLAIMLGDIRFPRLLEPIWEECIKLVRSLVGLKIPQVINTRSQFVFWDLRVYGKRAITRMAVGG